MTASLPPNLLALFAPREPIPFLPPIESQKLPPLLGIGELMSAFEPHVPPPSNFKPWESRKMKRERLLEERRSRDEERVIRKLKEWDPSNDKYATDNPQKTLFVGRIAFNTSEKSLLREFEPYGPIKKIRLVMDLDGKSRGYAFIEYEKERDMKSAYKAADGKKIDNRRVLVDTERGRSQKGWRPRRLGGGLGFTRAGGVAVNQKFSGREPPTRDGEPGPAARDDRDDRDRDRERERDRRSASPRRRDSRNDRDRDRNDRDRRDSRNDRDRDRRDDKRDDRRDGGYRDRDRDGGRRDDGYRDRDDRDRRHSYRR